MLSLYEILKASKTGIAPDMWTALAGKNWGGADSGHEVKELTGIPPLSFTADGTPLLDYLISGNMTQTGTPTPDAPITPSECGERTKNLFDKDNAPVIHIFPTVSDVVSERNDVYSIILPCKPNTTYTYSKLILPHRMHRVAGYAEYPTLGMQSVFLDDSSETIEGDEYAQNIFTTTADARWLLIIVAAQATYDDYFNLIQKLQVEESNGRTSYEPYGYKLTISSANTTTPVYLGGVETTRSVKKLVLTGDETIYQYSFQNTNGVEIPSVLDTTYMRTAGICTHYPVSTSSVAHSIWLGVNNNTLYMVSILDDLGISTVTQFKAYIAAQYAAGTPVTIWYVLATPETAVVNEPLRKIGNYADTLSYEQAGVSIPTLNGQTVIDVNTTLKPSEVYIKYKG